MGRKPKKISREKALATLQGAVRERERKVASLCPGCKEDYVISELLCRSCSKVKLGMLRIELLSTGQLEREAREKNGLRQSEGRFSQSKQCKNELKRYALCPANFAAPTHFKVFSPPFLKGIYDIKFKVHISEKLRRITELRREM